MFGLYNNRYLFIKKRTIYTGAKKDKQAYMYLGLDCARMTDEQHKLFKRAQKNKLDIDEVYESMQNEGIFGIISSHDYSCEEILPAYYFRQQSEQMFDTAKNYTKMLPLRVHNMETFQGHLLLSYIASCIVRLIQNKLKSEDLVLGDRLSCLRNMKCTIYGTKLITDNQQRIANETFSAFKIICPESLPIVKGQVQVPKVAKINLQEKKSPKRKLETSANTDDSTAMQQTTAAVGRKRKSGKNTAESTTAVQSISDKKEQPKKNAPKIKRSTNGKIVARKRGRPKKELLTQEITKKKVGRPKRPSDVTPEKLRELKLKYHLIRKKQHTT